MYRFLILIACLLTTVPAEEPLVTYAEVTEWETAHVQRLVKAADRIIVYRLDSSISWDGDGGFPIHPYGPDELTEILGIAELTADQLPAIKAALTTTIAEPSGFQMMCHYPGYGLRLFLEDRLIIETSICFRCHNFGFPSTGHYQWRELGDDVSKALLKQTLESYDYRKPEVAADDEN